MRYDLLSASAPRSPSLLLVPSPAFVVSMTHFFHVSRYALLADEAYASFLVMLFARHIKVVLTRPEHPLV